MQVKFISGTTGLGLTMEELIVYTARVSNPANQMNNETADKLLGYMIKNKHWSPFDMVDITFEIKTSRAIAQQILRHWSMRFQEFSQRYAEAVEFEPVQIRKAGATNRQSSEEEFDPTIDFGFLSDTASNLISSHLMYSMTLYKALLEVGVAKECARMILPLTTQTTLYMKGSARSYIHYFNQRLDPHAQLEHRQVAEALKPIFIELFPNISKAIEL